MTTAPAPASRPTLVCVVSRGALPRLETVVELMGDDEVLGAMPWAFVCAAETRDDVERVVAARGCAVSTIPDERRASVVDAMLDDGPDAPLSTVPVMLPKAREIADLSEAVAEITERMGDDIGRTRLLLPVSLTPEGVMPELIRRRMRSGLSIDPVTKELVERSSSLTSSARLEYLEPVDGAVRVGVWLGEVLPSELPDAPWTFEVALLRGRSVVAVSAPQHLGRRVDRFGVSRWDEFVADLPLADVASGNYVLGVRVHGLDNEDFVRLRARKGALLAARVTRLPVVDGMQSSFLLHSAPRGATVYLAVDRGPVEGTPARWRRTLARKDLNYVVRGRGSAQSRRLRLLKMITAPFFRGRQIWLVGERPDTAQDNGAHLFRHIRQEHPGRRVYYLVDRDSPQRGRIAPLGHVVAHSSWRHRLLLLHAEVLANAYSIHHMLPRGWDASDYEKHLAWRVGALRVYLKHGVHLSPNAVKRGLSGYHLVLAATHGESAALRSVTGYDAQVSETGLPRYDALVRTGPSRTVLFMSTWRRYLVPQLFGKGSGEHEAFEGSTYETFVRELLASTRLREMLERHDYRLTFLPHYNLAAPVAGLPTSGDRVRVAEVDEESIQDQLRSCDAFVTDYSSVHFDVAYMGTPVVYARFDEEEFETRHASPSWFDYDADGFGPVARTLDATLDEIERVLESGCTVEQVYADRARSAFVHRDRGSCARVVRRIDELVEAG
ncbi:CDP-glycerol glycerophosphotransferase family protein [Janibacter melonis]|uniref:CDP-glycerol glycerophosphotransferase family protein n=1 Tax=Janibacter melonis TaxID=262209 RepID=UPI001780E374|nr:hypothetical protein [Janibacter melonis]